MRPEDFGPVPDQSPIRTQPITWLGTCNRCGLCCSMEVKGYLLVCEHLRAVISGGQTKPLGAPEASRCGVYERRVDGMPIRLLDATGTPRMEGQCRKDHWLEDERIIARGIGKGCSLRIAAPGEVPDNVFMPTGAGR